MKMTIKTKIILSFCSLVFCILVAQVAFNMFYARDYFVEQNSLVIEQLYTQVIENYSDEPQALYLLTNEEDMRTGLNIQVFSDDKLIYSSRNIEGPSMFGYSAFSMGQGISPNRYSDYSSLPEATIIKSKDTDEMVIALNGIFDYNGANRYISLSMPLESIDSSVAMFTKVSIMINMFIMLVGIFVTILLAKGLSRPINSIEKVAKKLQNLDFSSVANENATTIELVSLAKSINSMSNTLEKSLNELKDANVQLQKDVDDSMKLEMMTKQFIANVSHEMKTPIALLQIHCDNLKNKLPGIDVDEYYDTILDESTRLNSIVNDMLNVSSLENGLLMMDYTQCSISALVQSVCKSMEPILSNYQFILNVQDNIFATVDQKHIAESLRNYINNAISHTAKGHIIEVCLFGDEEWISLEVYNEGESIKEVDLEKIWQGFYKSNQARTREKNVRAGLGLYIVKTIIHQHNGECYVKNEQNGVRFGFKLMNKS